VHLKKCQTKYVDETKKVVKSERGLKKIDLNRIKKTIIAENRRECSLNEIDAARMQEATRIITLSLMASLISILIGKNEFL
jgi:hypothetical protein